MGPIEIPKPKDISRGLGIRCGGIYASLEHTSTVLNDSESRISLKRKTSPSGTAGKTQMATAGEEATLVAALKERLSQPGDQVEQSLIKGGETGLDGATLRRWLRANRRVLRRVLQDDANRSVCSLRSLRAMI